MPGPQYGRQSVLAIVLAGGEGKRLLPLTHDRSKPAVPFGGKYRLIDFAISNIVNAGYRKIVVLTQYKSHSLDVHISTTWQLSNILGNYVTTVPAQMRKGPRWFTGSADALFQNMNLVDDERPDHIIVFGADHIYRLDPAQMLRAHMDSGAGVTVAGIRVHESQAFEFGVIEQAAESSRIAAFHEKNPDAPRLPDAPHEVLASMGNYIFRADTFREIMAEDAADESSAHDVGGNIIPKLVARGEAHYYDYRTNIVPGEVNTGSHYWRDVGTLDSYYEAHMDLVAPLPVFSLYNEQWPIYTRGITQPPAKVTDGRDGPSRVSNSILGDGVIVHGGDISESVVGRGARVENAEVHRSVLMDNVSVGPGARLQNCIIDKNVVIPPGATVGHDPKADASRFTISDGGVVAVPKDYIFEPINIDLAKDTDVSSK